MEPGSKMKTGSLVNAAAFVVVIAGMKVASPLIVPFLLAVFLAIICTPLLFWLQRRGVPDYLGLVIIMVLVIGAWLALAMLFSSALREFSRSLPYYQDRLGLITGEAWRWLSEHGLVLERANFEEFFNPGKLMQLAAGTLNGIGGILTNAFLIMLTFIFLLLEAAGIPDKIRAFRGGAPEALTEYRKITEGVNQYLIIKTMTSLATGALIFILLYLQKVDFAILWALLGFLLNFVPNIGSIIAAVPAVLLSLIQLGPVSAIVTAAGYLAINITIGSIIEPKVMGSGVGLSTLVVFLSLAFWGWVLGPVGMLLSVPLTMTVKIALGGSESTRHLALLLGSSKEVSEYLSTRDNT